MPRKFSCTSRVPGALFSLSSMIAL
jgi:hypothetical protein